MGGEGSGSERIIWEQTTVDGTTSRTAKQAAKNKCTKVNNKLDYRVIGTENRTDRRNTCTRYLFKDPGVLEGTE